MPRVDPDFDDSKAPTLTITAPAAAVEAEKTWKETGGHLCLSRYPYSRYPRRAVDNAIIATGFGTPVVFEFWDQNGAGPTQHMVGEARRWLSKY
jgi:hypothetical protein